MIAQLFEMQPVTLQQGLIMSLISLAVMVPFRILDRPDISAEGSYPLGGALCAVLLSQGYHYSIALVAAILAGGLLGLATTLAHLRLKIHPLLAGIILSTMAYSINLRLLGKPNISLFTSSTVFSGMESFEALKVCLLIAICLPIAFGFSLFCRTEYGLCLRAVGLNTVFSSKQGISSEHYIFSSFAVANGLSGLAGGLMVQVQQYADVSMGTGVAIHALAGLMIGETVLGTSTLWRKCLSPLAGSLIYQEIFALVLIAGVSPSDFKFVTGAIILAILGFKTLKSSD